MKKIRKYSKNKEKSIRLLSKKINLKKKKQKRYQN